MATGLSKAVRGREGKKVKMRQTAFRQGQGSEPLKLERTWKESTDLSEVAMYKEKKAGEKIRTAVHLS